MKKLLVAGALLSLAASYAAGQMPTVVIQGTVNANGTVIGTGVSSSGSAGGLIADGEWMGSSFTSGGTRAASRNQRDGGKHYVVWAGKPTIDYRRIWSGCA